MSSGIPDNAPPGAEALVDWAEEHAEEVGVASSEETGQFELTINLEGSNLLLAGLLGQGQTPPLWETASLAHWNGIRTESVLEFPQQLPEPPVTVADDGSTVTVRTVNAQLELTREGDEDGDEE